jgi:hypothetical protein
VFAFPDGTQRQLNDQQAASCAGVLWDIASGARTAGIAVAIRMELQRSRHERQPIQISERSAARVVEILDRFPTDGGAVP